MKLTNRELEVITRLARGLSAKEIARELLISPRTVEFHIANLFEKFDCNKTTQLIARAYAAGVL